MKRDSTTMMIGLAVGLMPYAAIAAPGDVAIKIEGAAGIARDQRPLTGSKTDFSGAILPSIGFRIGETLQIQADGMVADHLGDTVLATAGHIGIKPTANISIGVYGAYARLKTFDNLDTYRIGAEAAYHLDRVSLSGVAGYEHSEQATAIVGLVPGFTVVDDYGRKGNFFSMADITFYPQESWSLTAGHRYISGRHAAVLGTEKALSNGGFTLFAEGRIGNGGYSAGWAGIRLRFGAGGVSLRAQDRDNGYTNRLKDELFGASNARRRGQVALPPPPPPPPPSGGCGSCGGGYCA